MSILSKEEIIARMDEGPLKDRLVITPLLNRSQIGGVSVDLRLGFSFILLNRGNILAIDPMESNAQSMLEKYQQRITLSRGGVFHLHPGEFVLGASLEYIALPLNLTAHVTSRSSWGRVGLVIATAISVAPGFRGVITLELANVGVAPLALRPGVRVAQIIFTWTKPTHSYAGRYTCPTAPEFGKIHLDPDLKFWSGPSGHAG
ncbi:dCTP deaminase [Nitrospiraceae bacterium AH_259_D15_M11_P09]|nr:dCTP deaminase [Nitrospiraceae bacterium AH_259_D15_M11_P09]